MISPASTQQSIKLLYETCLYVWLLSYYEPSVEYLGTSSTLPRLVEVAKNSTKEKDLMEALNQLEEGLKYNIKKMNSFDKYKQEVHLGHLDWSPMHKDPTFWRENISSFEVNDFQKSLEPELSTLWEEPYKEQASAWTPCADKKGPTHQGKYPINNGFLMFSANGGINQQRVAVCNAVAVASLLNATLVIPKFLYSNVWNDPSFPDSLGDDLVIEVQDSKGKYYGRVVPQVASITDESGEKIILMLRRNFTKLGKVGGWGYTHMCVVLQ